MRIEFLVEEYSAEAVLINILPRILREDITYAIRTFNGKPDLLSQLPKRLKGYRHWLPEDDRIVVLVDQDREDCIALKAKLEETARQAGFTTKSDAGDHRKFKVVNRLAIEELEAWFFGDLEALARAYPRVSPMIGQKSQYRNPDAITGGTWEALERVLKKAGYCPGGMSKVDNARKISGFMEPDRNRSKSFQVFRDTLRGLVPPE
jgi:hypothetical protein